MQRKKSKIRIKIGFACIYFLITKSIVGQQSFMSPYSSNSGILQSEYLKAEKQEVDLIEYFDLQDTLYFNLKDLVIGEITKFIAGNNKSTVFIHDRIANSMYWVDLNTGSHKVLSVENIAPGHRLSILGIYKTITPGLWVASPPNNLFKFTDQGDAIQRIKSKKSVSPKFCINSNGDIIAYFDYIFPNYLSLISSTTGKETKIFDLQNPEKYKNALFRMNGGGLLIDRIHNIYFANPIENKIYKYNKTGRLLSVFKNSYKKYALLGKDMPGSVEGMTKFLQKGPNFSSVLEMGFLNESLIAIFYMNDQKTEMEIFSKEDGAVLSKNKIIIRNSRPAGVGNNFLYLSQQPKNEDVTGSLPNAFVIRYRLK